MKKVFLAQDAQAREMAQKMSPKGWQKAFFSVRTRLLVWYFLLTACTVFLSLQATRWIYCEGMKARSEAATRQQIDQFKLFAEKQRQKALLMPQNTAELFNKFLSSYAPTQNEYIITLLEGRIHNTRPALPNDLLAQYPELIAELALIKSPQMHWVSSSEQRLLYAAQPVNLPGNPNGTIVVLLDATADYQVGESAIVLVLQVTMVFLGVFFLLAWFTAKRVLSPMRLLTRTAQSISESDMTQRIPVTGNDELAEMTATFNDMLDRLRAAFDSQQEFLKDASHELRTPITVIQGHLEMLSYRPDRQTETITLLIDELERMNRLVNDLLLLAKTDRPDFLKLKPEELDWLTEELYLKAISLAERDWRLESKGLSPIEVDRQRLTQAVMNLVQNAIRHTQVGDTIALGSAVKENQAYLWVSDTGEGIDPADQERIFKRFVRATHHDHQFEGHGLGLSIVQAIVTAHKGRIELTSCPGQGATFTLILPLTSSLSSPSHEPNFDRRRQPSHQRLPGNGITSARIHHDNC
jgi:signal transduction histidine kinase